VLAAPAAPEAPVASQGEPSSEEPTEQGRIRQAAVEAGDVVL